MDADRDDIKKEQDSRRVEARKRRRIRLKGPEPPDQEQGPGSMRDLFERTSQVCNLLWTILMSTNPLIDTIFSVASAFWPRGQYSNQELLERVAADIIKTLAGLKWRLCYRAEAPPYCFLDLCDPDADVSEAMGFFLQMNPCCLDAFWARPIQEELKELTDIEEQAKRFHRHIRTFAANLRSVSSREENMHAKQRASAGGFKSKAALFSRQSAESVLRNSLEHFVSRTGAVPDSAPQQVKNASKFARKRIVKHKRPGQFGSAMFHFMNTKRKEGVQTLDQLKAEWSQMPPASKAAWRTQHIAKVARRRLANSHMAELEDEKEPPASPWQLGDDRHPISNNCLAQFLTPFQRRSTGLEELAKYRGEDAKELYRAVVDMGQKYHSSDTAATAAKDLLGEIVDDNNSKQNTWAEVMECTREPQCCFEKHPGLCATRDAAKISGVEAFCRMLPKGNHIFMFELASRPARERVAIFAQVVTGQFCKCSRLLSISPLYHSEALKLADDMLPGPY